MAQDSIAYGESLLADVRKRNSDAERRERKDARRGEWKGLAAKIGINLVDDIFAQKQANLLNSEEALKAKLGTTRALEFGTSYTKAETAAQGFTGGEDAYWASQAAPQIESYLQSKYQKGTYNTSAYNLYAKQLTNKFAQELKAQHKEGYDLTQKFFAAGGKEKDVYVNAVKKSQPATALKGLSNLIGKGTGLLDADLHNNTSMLLETSEALTSYKDAYAQTNDSALSTFLAEEGLMDKVDFGAPDPEIGTAIKKTNALGEEEIFFPVKNTVNGKKTITLVGLDNNGQFNFSSPQAQATTNQFDSLASVLEAGKGVPFFNAGNDAIASLDTETNEELAEAVAEMVKLPVASQLYKPAIEKRNKRIHAEAGAIIYTATKKEGWANTADAKIIAAEMVSSAYINGNKNRALAGSGLKNPYHTMFAVNSAIDKGKINSFDSLAILGSMDNVVNMYNAYATETKPNREAIDALLEANNYFGDKVGGGDLFKQLHTTVKATFEKGVKGTDDTLGLMYQNLYGNKKPEGSASETSETKEESQVIDIATLPIPAAADERGIITADTRRQMRAYKKIMELDKKIKARNEKIAYFSEEDTYNKGAIVNISQALEKEQNRFNNLYANYKNKYGSTEE